MSKWLSSKALIFASSSSFKGALISKGNFNLVHPQVPNGKGTKVRSCNCVSITSNPADECFLLEVKTITKPPRNGIAESVKSCNLH